MKLIPTKAHFMKLGSISIMLLGIVGYFLLVSFCCS